MPRKVRLAHLPCTSGSMRGMGFVLEHADGRLAVDPPLEEVEAAFARPVPAGASVAVRHERGWRLTAYADGVVELDCDTDPRVEVRHASGIARGALAELAVGVAVGSFYEALDHEWRTGPRPPATAAG